MNSMALRESDLIGRQSNDIGAQMFSDEKLPAAYARPRIARAVASALGL
jgi:hypothetical protein